MKVQLIKEFKKMEVLLWCISHEQIQPVTGLNFLRELFVRWGRKWSRWGFLKSRQIAIKYTAQGLPNTSWSLTVLNIICRFTRSKACYKINTCTDWRHHHISKLFSWKTFSWIFWDGIQYGNSWFLFMWVLKCWLVLIIWRTTTGSK